jgi:hypothetical protein
LTAVKFPAVSFPEFSEILVLLDYTNFLGTSSQTIATLKTASSRSLFVDVLTDGDFLFYRRNDIVLNLNIGGLECDRSGKTISF